ncbi:MAG: hypothetical protein AB8F78_02955 [Saprospiraceae bacterium]
MKLTPLLLSLFITTVASAQIYSNEFLSIGAGSRAQAMGNSAVASSTGIYAAYWNPAGLTGVDGNTGLLAGAMHAEQFAGVTKYDYLGVSLPLGNDGRRIAFSLIRQGTDDIPNTLNLYNPDGSIDYDNITSFSAADYAALISYAQPTKLLDGKVSVGGNLKVVRRIIGDFSTAWGVGIDLGARYHNGAFMAGVTLRDATSTFNAWKTDLSDEEKTVLLATGNSLPDASGTEVTNPSLLPGVRYRFGIGENIGIAPELTAWMTFDGKRNTLLSSDPISMDLNLGVEADYKNMVFLRFGADQFQRYAPLGEEEESLLVRPAIGLGVKYKRVNLDYAFSNPGNGEDLYAHVFSLQFGLAKPTAKDVN